ncbi:hypothetical protein WICMUC_000465 [Wickerhamomyces mucosus]|uniref:Uncharacterized protein n=1 Tax=Wickerhamomyces mucosus TaxID=1378264 RepID=A0A9P8PZ33_9ASCO|nr:hypothetical protein WICMUC_000465 [Wickerhamomyces mucosus]
MADIPREMSEVEELEKQIEKLQKEVNDLRKVSVFSDIQPYIEENETKYKKVKISTVGLTYLIRHSKSNILQLLIKRIAEDLHRETEDVQLIDPISGFSLKGDEDLLNFENDGVIRLDFQYKQTLNECGIDHHHSHFGSDDDFSDDDNFYSTCSCSNPH